MKVKHTILIGFALLLAPLFLVQAQIPRTLSYQGVLTDPAGNIKPDGPYTFTFRLYDVASAGTALWTETETNTVKDGLFSTTLGEQTAFPAALTFDKPYWLGIQVEGEELAPRIELTSSPYSLHALRADTAEYAWQTPTGEGLTLPFSGTNTTSSSDAFTIINSPANNIGNAITITNNGNGDGIQIDGGGYSAIDINKTSGGPAIDINTTGTTTVTTEILDIDNGWLNAVAAYLYNSNSSNNKPVLEVSHQGTGLAAKFWDDVDIQGTLSKSAGSFKIDHPLDPENKYLYHSFVESPDMMNVYNGNIILDNNGEAIVELPEWFEVLNKDFRYQLTCIGGYAPVYIAEEISNNSFKISGGTPGMKISWQVTGIRQDPYANENRIQVEVEKPDKETGHYLHYKEYNQPIEKSIKVVKHPEILEVK